MNNTSPQPRVSLRQLEAKTTVTTLLTDLGWKTDTILDLGDISTARGPERFFTLFVGIAQAIGSPLFGIALVRPTETSAT